MRFFFVLAPPVSSLGHSYFLLECGAASFSIPVATGFVWWTFSFPPARSGMLIDLRSRDCTVSHLWAAYRRLILDKLPT